MNSNLAFGSCTWAAQSKIPEVQPATHLCVGKQPTNPAQPEDMLGELERSYPINSQPSNTLQQVGTRSASATRTGASRRP